MSLSDWDLSTIELEYRPYFETLDSFHSNIELDIDRYLNSNSELTRLEILVFISDYYKKGLRFCSSTPDDPSVDIPKEIQVIISKERYEVKTLIEKKAKHLTNLIDIESHKIQRQVNFLRECPDDVRYFLSKSIFFRIRIKPVIVKSYLQFPPTYDFLIPIIESYNWLNEIELFIEVGRDLKIMELEELKKLEESNFLGMYSTKGLSYRDIIAYNNSCYVSKSMVGLYNELIKYLNNPYQEELKVQPQTTVNPGNIKRAEGVKRALRLSFSDESILEKVFEMLRPYFPNHSNELLRALKDGSAGEKLVFPNNQSKLVEVFYRLKYNGFLFNDSHEIKGWILRNFKYQFKRGTNEEVRDFKEDTIHSLLSRKKGIPSRNKAICIYDWLPYFTEHQLNKRANN